MASRAAAKGRVAHLWQLPLLLVSLGLFGYAAYLFIDPKPGLSIDQKIDVARTLLRNERPAAAVEHLNKLLNSEKLVRENEARIHLMLAQSIEAAQKQSKIDLDVNHERIVEQSRVALAQGIKPDGDLYRRLGESFEALGRPAEALENFRRAMAMDDSRSLSLRRKVIDLQLTQSDTGPADASLDEYLKDPNLADAERAWALGKKSELLVQAGRYLDAKALLGVALRSESDPTVQGQIHYSLGYCATKLGDAAEAERLLRVARDQLKTQHPTDADAAYALGRLRQEAGDFKEAAAFYEDVLVSHPEAPVAPLARLGRGVCRLALAHDEAGLTDLQDLVNEIGAKKSRQKFKPDVVAGLRKGAALLAERGNYQGDLELLAREQTLEPKPSPDFFNRLAAAFARRAEQVERSLPEAADVAERLRRGQQVRDLRTKAGDAYVAYSRSVTVDDDKAYGEALWKGVDLYDRAGNISHAISALELFVAERPTDGAAPEALLRLGKAYQAAGQFDKAISAYQRNQSRYPQSLAAAKSGVPLAQAYVAQGPQSYPNAEKALLRVVDDNPLITPDAEEFRLALFELAQLYYRSDRFEQSIARLEELTDRYPGHEHTAQLLFMMADGYRKSGALLDARVASADPGAGAASAATQAEAAAQKQERLTKAQALYDQVIAAFADGQPAPVDPLDKLYLKLSHFYRADCAYDLGRYDDAIRLYQTAASRYQDDSSAMSAHVQIVNAYCSLGKKEQARAANRRAIELLRRMPVGSANDGKHAMPKAYWEKWLKWTDEAGMWPVTTATPGSAPAAPRS